MTMTQTRFSPDDALDLSTPEGRQAVGGRIAAPEYDRDQIRAGIVHIGVGGFHRSHQAMYLDRLLSQPDTRDEALGWGICGVDLMPGDRPKGQALAAQDGLYTLVDKKPDGALEPRVIGSIVRYLFAPEEPAEVLEALASPQTKHRLADHHRGRLQLQPGHGRVRRGPPGGPWPTWPRRRAAHRVRLRGRGPASPPRPRRTAVHGDVVRQHPGQRRHRPRDVLGLRRPPGSRPRRLDAHRGRVPQLDGRPDHARDDRAGHRSVARDFGIRDAVPVVCEPFTQWVLQDVFPAGRPPWSGPACSWSTTSCRMS